MSELPSHEQEAEEIVRDARKERLLVLQAVIAATVVAVVVVLRELFLR